MATTAWQFLVPQLPVRDVPASQRWYRDALGFEVRWTWLEDFGAVGNGECEIFLARIDDPRPVTTCVFVDDVDAVYEEYRARGAEIDSELESKPWGLREFTVRDPDGNLFRIGTGEKPIDQIAEFTVPGHAEL
jgi:catechol 2,3-dioxygenase-like lactoylglutathione lyase family enzyme